LLVDLDIGRRPAEQDLLTAQHFSRAERALLHRGQDGRADKASASGSPGPWRSSPAGRDEPISSLDVSIQAQIMKLRKGIQEDSGVAYLFIAYDLAVVRWISHRIECVRSGRIEESGSTARICEKPGDPYTKALLAAAPMPDPRAMRQRRAHREDFWPSTSRRAEMTASQLGVTAGKSQRRWTDNLIQRDVRHRGAGDA
jgi:hypothetical protein